MQYSQEHLKTMVYAEFGGQTECIMGNWKIENGTLFLREIDFADRRFLASRFLQLVQSLVNSIKRLQVQLLC